MSLKKSLVIVFLVLFLGFLYVAKDNVVFAGCATKCGWTGTSASDSCVIYELNPGQDCGWDGSVCKCIYATQCPVSGPWPAACPNQNFTYIGVASAACCTSPTPTPVPTPTPQVCTPNAWGACGCYLGACYAPQCLGDGTGWVCRNRSSVCCPAPTPTPVPTPTPAPAPDCAVDLQPNVVNIEVGESAQLAATMTLIGSAVSERIFFRFQDTGSTVATLNPIGSVYFPTPYITTVTGQNVGTTNVGAFGFRAVNIACTQSLFGSFDITTVNVTAPVPGPWWWVKGSVLSGGDITSDIEPASGSLLIPAGFQIQPGIAIYKGNLSVGNGSVSTTNWNAHVDSISGTEGNSYEGFLARVPSDAVAGFVDNNLPAIIDTGYISSNGFDYDGYSWYKRTGDLAINGNVTVINKKVVIFVDGNVTIFGDVRLSNATNDFFMLVASGNITLNGTSTAELQGIYFADGVFNTGAGSTVLTTYGSIFTNGGITLARNLGASNTTLPAEKFKFAPELYINYPTSLSPNKIIWKEVAP